MTIIPPSAYAVAAYEAARLFQEDPADLFDPDCKSRARFVAIEVLKRAFPKEAQAVIARNIGMEGNADSVAGYMDRARMAGWWDPMNVDFVAILLSKHLRRPVTAAKVRKAARALHPEESQHVPGAVFTPRKGRPSRWVVRQDRPRDVTGYLMGDPGTASARVDRGEMSAGVRE